MKKVGAFTLIELLIVVAIIAILAAIAVPNFLEAQTRSKVSRAHADMRTISTGLESYFIDNNAYPTHRPPRPIPGDPTNANLTLGVELSTPISYLTSINQLDDPFRVDRSDLRNHPVLEGRQRFGYTNFHGERLAGNPSPVGEARFGNWRLYSAGPDRYFFHTGQQPPGDFTDWATINYDPTNGTMSYGDIFRSQRFTIGGSQE